MPADHATPARPNIIARILGLEKHEYIAVAWSFLYFFCVLSAYYTLRSVRETMAVVGGVQNIPWLFLGTFTAMLLVTPVYGFIASRYPRRQFLPWVYYFFAANILLFWVGFSHARANEIEFTWIGRAFFVWLSVFNLFVVSVFWSFMADIYTHEQCRRLFGLISAGGSMGALLGPLATSVLVVPLGFENLLPLSAALLLVCVVCIGRLTSWVQSSHAEDIAESMASTRPLGGSALAGVTHVARSSYLLAICVGSAIASLMGTALYIFMAQLVSQAMDNPDEITRIYALIDAAINGVALVGQLLVVRHAVRYWGIGVTLSLLPLISLAGFALLALNPVFAVVVVLQVVRRGIGFGITKPTNDMLYSVVTPEEKYKAKNFIDTAIYRGGDVVSAWIIQLILALGIAGISVVMLPFAVIWALVSLWLGRDYRRRDALGVGGG